MVEFHASRREVLPNAPYDSREGSINLLPPHTPPPPALLLPLILWQMLCVHSGTAAKGQPEGLSPNPSA